MARNNNQIIQRELDTIIELLQRILALELSRSDVTKEAIGKHLHVAKASVVNMLRGVNKENNRMTEKILSEISKKLNVFISLSIRQLLSDKEFVGKGKRKQGVGDLARYLSHMGLDAKDIAEILGAPLSSVRTLLTPKRRK